MRIPQRRSTRVVPLAAGLAAAGLIWLRCGPLPPGLLDNEAAARSTAILDRHGERLYEVRSAAGLRGERIEASRLPPRLAQATMAAEDIRFRWHVGLDPIAIVRAAVHNVRAGQVVEGGSTITQQVAGLLLARASGTAGRGWTAKAREAVVALRLEHRLSKDEILALYLSLAPYGNQIEGAARAARAYFGREAGSLTPAEAAFLAALPQQPSRFNPWRDASLATSRQIRVLRTMAARGWITGIEHQAALAERLTLTREAAAIVAPHFVERVIDGLGGRHPAEVRTTLDAGLQRDVTGIIAAHRPLLARHHAANVAVAVLDNATGEWLAWEGSGNYFDAAHGGMIDGVVTPRQPGSALKPFTYAAAFERGAHPGYVLADVPSHFPTADPTILYSPRNYDGRFRGPLLARVALAGSENVPAVALASEVGVPAIARLLRRAGIGTLDNHAAYYGLGLTLGNAEVRLGELVAAYAVLARGGDAIPARMIGSIDGVAEAGGIRERVLSLRTAFWITDILADADARAYVFGRGGSLEFPFEVAAKTGTSQSYFDNWVIGYTRDVTVGVWVGNFDRTPLRNSSGVTGAGPIFHAVMLAAVERARGALPIGDRQPILPPPPGVHRAEICATSGMAAGDACPTRASEWLADEAPAARCTWHHASEEGVITVWPEIYLEWARSNGLVRDRDVVAARAPARSSSENTAHAGAVRSAAARRLEIARPLAGATFLIDPTLRPEFQTLAFAARGGEAGSLEWRVNGDLVGSTPPDGTLRWPLVRGRHVIAVRDTRGQTDEVEITVR